MIDMIMGVNHKIAEWLVWNFPELGEVPVLQHAAPEDVRGKIVLGDIPLSLAVHARAVIIPHLPASWEAMTFEQLDETARLSWPAYVKRVRGEVLPDFTIVVEPAPWVYQRWPELEGAPVIEHPTLNDVRHRVVVGDIPISLASEASAVVLEDGMFSIFYKDFSWI